MKTVSGKIVRHWHN